MGRIFCKKHGKNEKKRRILLKFIFAQPSKMFSSVHLSDLSAHYFRFDYKRTITQGVKTMNFSASNQSVDVEKPRRLEEETAIYLSGLEPQLEDAENNDNIEILIDNVLDEIKQRTASAASDRRTNFIIEKICNFANISQLMEVIKRCAPYVLFLSQNRHSSHVVQSIIARLCYLLRAGETFDVDLDNLETVILSFAEPILSNFAWMAGEISGSHVLRSMVCLLTGMPLISERKSTTSKHQHSVALSEPLEKLIVPDLYYIDSKLCFQVPDAFHTALYNAVEGSLLGQTDSEGKVTGTAQSFSHELQLMISDTSCCAAVVILLRILFTPDLIPGGPELAEQIVICALDWTSKVDSAGAEADPGASVFYAMGGDKSGSYFLEAVIECCSVSFLIELVQRCLLSRSDETIQEFVEDNVANFIIQSVMKRITSVFYLNTKTDTLLPEYDALHAISTRLLSDTHGLLKPDLFSYLVQCKGGVVLWMLKLGKAMSLSKESKHISETNDCLGHAVATRVVAHWTHCEVVDIEAESFITALDSYMVKRFETTAPAAEDSKVKDMKKKGGTGGGKASTASNKPNAAALLVARLLGAILSLDGSSDMAGVVCRMLCRLPHETLLNIACSGPISRSILDVFFESKSNGRERSIFLTSFLMPNLKTVCAHAIAHHTLRKCFESASSVDKERVAEAVVVPSFYETIAHTREGKAVIRFTQCDLYARNISEWKALIVRQKKAQAMLAEMENVTVPSQARISAAPAPVQTSYAEQYTGYANSGSGGEGGGGYASVAAEVNTSTGAVAGDAGGAGAVGGGARKRKRKRTSSKKEAAEEATVGGEQQEEQEPEGVVSSSDIAIDNIFEKKEEEVKEKKEKKKHKRDKDAKEDPDVAKEDIQRENLEQEKVKKEKKHKKSKKSGHSGYDNSSHKHTDRHSGGNGSSVSGKADFQKIKLLSSAKMMSIKKLTENL
jgi:hypothetical protein